jgi:RHS repeat-associated protein
MITVEQHGLSDPGGGEVSFFHLDALGSVRLVTNSSGAKVGRYDYLPFGGEWLAEGTVTNSRRYTGQERDVETSAGALQALDYFGARYYQSQTGRFTSTDPVLDVDKALVDPQRWNRYTYGVNNSLRFFDPDGREVVAAVFGAGIGFLAGGGTQIVVNKLTNRPWSENVGMQAGIGAATGALTGFTFGVNLAFRAQRAGVMLNEAATLSTAAKGATVVASATAVGAVVRQGDGDPRTKPFDGKAVAKDAGLAAVGFGVARITPTNINPFVAEVAGTVIVEVGGNVALRPMPSHRVNCSPNNEACAPPHPYGAAGAVEK